MFVWMDLALSVASFCLWSFSSCMILVSPEAWLNEGLNVGYGDPEVIEHCGIDVVPLFGFDVQKVGICFMCQVINPLDVFSVLKLLGKALDWCRHCC